LIKTHLKNYFKDNPSFRYAGALLEEQRTLPHLLQLTCFWHTVAWLPMALYFIEFPTSAELVDISSGCAEDEEEDDEPHLDSYITTTLMDWKRFATAARRAPLFALPPFFFVMYIGILNVLSFYVRKAPVTRNNWNHFYKKLSPSFDDPRWLRDFTLDVRPLFLNWTMFVPPITIFNMTVNNIQSLVRPLLKRKEVKDFYGFPCVRFTQQRELEAHNSNFYFSPWFTPVTLLPFVLGIPTAISLWIYWHLGVDKLLHYPSHEPGFFTIFVLIGLYFAGLGSSLCILFFRSYFTYPTNFCSTEYDIEIYDDVIKAMPIKGWVLDFVTIRNMNDPKQIRWADVSSITFSGGNLKTEIAKSQDAILLNLKKLTTIYESVANKLDVHTEKLEIISKTGRSLHINLWELTSLQKLELFQLLRKNAPSIYLEELVQNALTGSTVLREPKYTEIWFSVLKGNNSSFREGDLEQGRSLREGRYRIKSKLASGGQAVVYLAVDQNDKSVVLKEFQLTTGESLDVQIESAKDFENESAILDQLSHPGIVKSLDIFYEEGRVYLVLENVEGKSLRQLIADEDAMTGKEIFSLAEQMCDILKYLHSQVPPVVHRDFTPDNIILQPNGKLKLIDFSVAQHKKNPNSSDCAGKHSYTPPEQFRGAACPQSDIYALGASLYYLATGKDPLPISTSRLPQTGDALTKALTEVIAGATELDLHKRYESIDWLLVALRESGLPEASGEPTDLEGFAETTTPQEFRESASPREFISETIDSETASVTQPTILAIPNTYRGPHTLLVPNKDKVLVETVKLRRRIN
jgi:serine/threonine protein kinase